jgi:hypothetical protein
MNIDYNEKCWAGVVYSGNIESLMGQSIYFKIKRTFQDAIYFCLIYQKDDHYLHVDCECIYLVRLNDEGKADYAVPLNTAMRINKLSQL